MNDDRRRGVSYAIAAYGLWGLMPLYFTAIRAVPPGEVLAQRIVWCGLLMAAVVAAVGRLRDVADALRNRTVLGTFLLSAALLSGNWLVYIYGVTTGQTVETSLGYFINPLINVALGVAVFRERLRPGQAVALTLAAIAVVIQVVASGQPPWIALVIAVSFGLYGLVRKLAAADTLLGLTIETLVLFPMALAYLTYLVVAGRTVVGSLDGWTLALLLASGVVTAVPLLCFGQAARLLPLSMLGFIQYLGPTLQFLTAVLLLGEAVSPVKWASFGLIWLALAVYSAETLASTRKAEPVPVAPID